jgi:hypothetical protein
MMRPHPLEIRPVVGYSRRVHAGAFVRAVETIMNFDQVDESEAVRRVMNDLEAGTLRLKVIHGHAAYQFDALRACRKERIRKDEFDAGNPQHFRLQSRGGAWRYYRKVGS